MLRILHAADFHLDSPFSSLPPELAVSRRAEQRVLMGRLAELAEARKADIVLLAGDLFDGGKAYYETYQFLMKLFSTVRARIFIAPGNHDHYSSRSPYAVMSVPENVTVFRSSVPEKIALPELNAEIWGAAFTGETALPPLRGRDFSSENVSIGVFHGDVTNSESPYGAISTEDIARSGLDYLALGHVHSFSGLQRAGSTFYAYPGCPEGRGFDETGEKGVLFVEAEKGDCRAEFIPLGGRKYEILKTDISDLENVESILPPGTKRDIYRLVLTGETDAEPDLREIESRLAEKFYHLSLRDETQRRRDVWEDAQMSSLRGLFLRKMKKRFDEAPNETEKNKIMLAVRYGLAALESREEIQR